MEGGEKERRSRSVSIPQAVSTIAISCPRPCATAFWYPVSIPQAVSTIAIKELKANGYHIIVSFNTASGKYYCNTA